MEVLQDDVCFILDLEGFFLDKTFYVRELAYYTWKEEHGRHPFFFFFFFFHFRTVQELERQRQTNCEFCATEDAWIDISTPQG